MALFTELLDIDRTPNPLPALVPPTWPDYRMPTALELRNAAGAPRSTFFARDLLLAEDVRKAAQSAGLRMICRTAIAAHGQPRSSRATCDEDVVQL